VSATGLAPPPAPLRLAAPVLELVDDFEPPDPQAASARAIASAVAVAAGERITHSLSAPIAVLLSRRAPWSRFG
jgi:hypothetical protein